MNKINICRQALLNRFLFPNLFFLFAQCLNSCSYVGAFQEKPIISFASISNKDTTCYARPKGYGPFFVNTKKESLRHCSWRNKNKPYSFFKLRSVRDDEINDKYRYISNQVQRMKIHMLETELSRPPHHHNLNLSPQEFVLQILDALYTPHYPLPDSGYRVLLRSSTKKWRQEIYQSIGMSNAKYVLNKGEINYETKKAEYPGFSTNPKDWDEDKITAILGQAFSSSKSQFGILVGQLSSSLPSISPKNYEVTFPSDVVDFNDGTCWLECRLLDSKTGSLMVIMGWQLKRELSSMGTFPIQQNDEYDSLGNDFGVSDATHGAWFIDSVDWQDFRDKYRPGLGREEWMRICG